MSKSKSVRITKYLAYLTLTILAIIWLFPIVYAFTTSFKNQGDVMKSGFHMFPSTWILDNYIKVLTNTSSAPILRWFLNSFIISGTHTLLVVLLVSLAAYGYSRMEWKYRDTVFFVVLAISMFPGVVNIIPSYKIVDVLGWVNTPLAVIMPGLGGVGNVFLVRQFMLGIPKSYDESARIDGATDFQIYSRIMVPLIKPSLIVAGIFSFTGSWNDFLWPTIVLNDVNKLTVTAGLQLLQDIYGNYMVIGQLMASALLAMIPTMLLFIFAQDYFMDAMDLNMGVKG